MGQRIKEAQEEQRLREQLTLLSRGAVLEIRDGKWVVAVGHEPTQASSGTMTVADMEHGLAEARRHGAQDDTPVVMDDPNFRTPWPIRRLMFAKPVRALAAVVLDSW